MKKKKAGKFVMIRLTEEDYSRLKNRADRLKICVSSLTRSLAFQEIERQEGEAK